MIITAGLDLGQQNDYSALVIAEAHGTVRQRNWGDCGKWEALPLTAVNVRHAERYPLHTPYEAVAKATDAWVRSLPEPRHLAVDHTGPGIPIAEMFIGLTPAAWLTLTTGSGSREVESPFRVGSAFHVSKRDLIAGVQVALEQRILKIARQMPHAAAIETEARAYVGKVTQHGNLTYEAQRESDHDDLVCALAMAIWLATEAFHIVALREQDAFDDWRMPGPYRISPI